MLIKAVTGKEVPPGKLPMDVEAVIQNIGTAIAIHDAVVKGEVLITAALTVSGKGIKNPKNLIVPVGTPIQNVIDYCGGVTEDAVKIVVGGPMMGVAQFDLTRSCDESNIGNFSFNQKMKLQKIPKHPACDADNVLALVL